MQQLEVFLRSRHCVARKLTLTANGFSKGQVDAALRAGLIHRVGRGVVALEGADPALVEAARNGAALSCVSAAALLDWWVLAPASLTHLRCDRALALPDAVVHRGRRSVHRLIAAPREIIRDAFRCLPGVEALVIAESAVVSNAVGLEKLKQEFSGPRDWRILRLLDTVRRTTRSPLEVCARFHLLVGGFHLQQEVMLPGVGRVDFLVDGWLILEIDGYAFHSGRTEYRKDRQRWNCSSAGGWVTLRITAEMVLYSPDRLIELVQRTCHTWNPARRAPNAPVTRAPSGTAWSEPIRPPPA